MEDQMTRVIGDLDAPQFRCVYLPNAKYNSDQSNGANVCAFVFAINHGIIDGMSSIATLRKFRLLLNELCTGKPLSIEPWPKMHPPSDYYFKRAFENLPEERRLAAESEPPMNCSDMLNQKPSLFIEKRGLESFKDPTIKAKTCLIVKEFSETETQKLRLACRAQNATIQAAAQIAAAIAMAQLLQQSDEWETLTINYCLPANMRPRIAHEVSVDYTGLYVSLLSGFSATVGNEFATDDSFMSQFWKLTKESTATIKEKIKNEEYLESFLTFATAEGIEDIDPTKATNEGRSEEDFFVTSYGAWDFPVTAEDVVKPLAVYSNSSIHVEGSIFGHQLITVNGVLTWTMAWSPRVVNRDTAEECARLIFEILDKVIHESN